MFAKSDEIPSRKNQNVAQTDRLRITKGNNSIKELAHSPYFSIITVHIVDINVFAKFYEIPSLPFQDTEKPKRPRCTNGRENSIHPPTTPTPMCETTDFICRFANFLHLICRGRDDDNFHIPA